MARIETRELKPMGEGTLFRHNKLYIPARVAKYLELNTDEGVTYYQILDPNYQDVVVIKKVV